MTQARILAGIAHGRRAFSGPYQAGIWLSNRCNLRCIHCYFYSPLLDEPNYFEMRAARRGDRQPLDRLELKALRTLEANTAETTTLIDDLTRMGTWGFHFGGNGEPMLHPDFLQFAGRVKRAGRTCFVNTNGTLLDRQSIEALVGMRFDLLRITTMAGTGEVYARTHPGSPPGTFDMLKEGLSTLVERKRAAGTGLPVVQLTFIPVQQNWDGLPDFVRLADEVGADSIAVHPVGAAEDPCMAPLLPTEAQAAAIRRQLPELERFLEERGIRHNLGWFAKVFGRGIDTRALYSLIPCHIGWLSIQVDVDGTVYPCCRCYRPLGNAHKEGVAAVWNSPAYSEFRRAAVRINRRGTAVDGCSCWDCPHSGANMRTFRILHPLSRRLRALDAACGPFKADGGEMP